MSTEVEYRDAIVAAHPYVPGPHDPGDSEFFQESVFLCWADHETGFGGFQRIGQEVNRGLSNQWTAAYGPDGTSFRDLDPELELRDEWRTEEYFKGGEKTTCYFEGDSRWEVRTPEYEADLELHDLYPFTPFYAAGKNKATDWAEGAHSTEEFQPRHWEAASRITGRVKLSGKPYEIDGYAIRDHSFGFRDWTIIRNHRAFVGTFGPAMSFSCLVWQKSDDSFNCYAYVNRDGEEEWTDDADIAVIAGVDGITLRGGEAVFRMPSGEEIRVTAKPRAAIQLPHREYMAVDHSCEISCGDLTGGYGDLEVMINPFDGRRYPTASQGAVISDGLHRP
jgi:hypothetical protein